MRCRRCDHEMEPEYAEYDGWLSPGDADRLLEKLATERKRADRLERHLYRMGEMAYGYRSWAKRLKTACHLALIECSLRAHIDYERVIYVVEKLLTEALDEPDKNKGETG